MQPKINFIPGIVLLQASYGIHLRHSLDDERSKLIVMVKKFSVAIVGGTKMITPTRTTMIIAVKYADALELSNPTI